MEHGDEWGQAAPEDTIDSGQPPQPAGPDESKEVSLATDLRSTVFGSKAGQRISTAVCRTLSVA